MILQILAAALLSTEATPSRPTLSGVIRTIDGEPIEGGLVFIYTARPRQGSSTTCPSCYLDCRRRARTGGNGAFEIAGVDPSLLFRVGVAADGYVASFQEDVDPTAGPISVSLTPEPALPTNPRRVLRGRVVEPHGSPVVGALIEPIGYRIEQAGPPPSWLHSFGPFGVNPTITGTDGQFAFSVPLDVDSLFLTVEARDLAPRTFGRVATGNEERVLRMGRGRSIKGRIVREGQPVARVVVGAVQVSRDAGTFVGERTAEADAEGRFLLLNLPTDEPLVLYGKVESLEGRGALAERDVDTATEGDVRDLGELVLETGVMVAGRVVLADGKPIPEHTRISVDRMRASDRVEAELGPQGSFRLGPFPRESVELSIRVAGYELSPDNVSLLPDSADSRLSLGGRLERDTNLRVVLTPTGPRQKRASPRSGAEWGALSERQAAIRARSLEGAPEQR